MNKMKKKILFLVLAVVFLGGAFFFFAWKSSGEGKPLARTVMVGRGELVLSASASGTVEAELRVDVKSRASGEVIELAVQPGDTVARDDLLVRLDPTDEENKLRDAELAAASAGARVEQAVAAMAAARTNAQDAEARAARRRSALLEKLMSGEDVATANATAGVAAKAINQRAADLHVAQAENRRAQIAIVDARRRLAQTVIRSPVAGTAIAVDIDRGAIVASGISNVGGGTKLLTVADLSKLYVIVALDEASIGLAQPGLETRIRIDAFPETTFSGVVDRVTPLGIKEANIVTFAVKVRVTDPQAYLLLPGMSADVDIITQDYPNVLLVPAAAIHTDTLGAGAGARRGHQEGKPPQPRQRSRYVVLASGEHRAITTGASDGAQTIVLEGLSEGDEVALSSPGSAPASKPGNALSSMFGGGRRR